MGGIFAREAATPRIMASPKPAAIVVMRETSWGMGRF